MTSKIESNSIDTVISSPPYYGLRDYGTGKWIGGNSDCDHKSIRRKTRLERGGLSDVQKGNQGGFGDEPKWLSKICPKCNAHYQDTQWGLEETPELYLLHMTRFMDQINRVLKDSGTCWINLGDTYAGSGKGRNADGTHQEGGKQGTSRGTIDGKLTKTHAPSCKPKDLIGIPWMLAFALRADGWYLRQDIIWHKPNPMPESVRDRCTKAHEYIFLLSKSPKYYYDYEAVKETAVGGASGNKVRTDATIRSPHFKKGTVASGVPWEGKEKRNRRSVWTVNLKPYKGAHFATFPPTLIEPCVLAGSRENDIVNQ